MGNSSILLYWKITNGLEKGFNTNILWVTSITFKGIFHFGTEILLNSTNYAPPRMLSSAVQK